MKQTVLNHLLDCSQEESAEIIQIISKIKRFGLEEIWPNKDKNPLGLTNKQRLAQEYADLVATIEELEDECGFHLFSGGDLATLVEAKKERLRKYMAYSREKGLLE